MKNKLRKVMDFIEEAAHLSAAKKKVLLKSVMEADNELSVSAGKLDIQNRELNIETSLERVRAIALSIKAPAGMLQVCKTIAKELNRLGVKQIRNVQTAIFYDDRGTYMNYEYYAKHHKTFITETSYTNHAIHRAFAKRMLKGKGGFIKTHISKEKLPGWIAYQKTTNVFIDTFLKKASSLTYYWYSLGPVALGISTYFPLTKEEINLFKRFRNVFELAYRRFLDIEKAEKQAKEAQVEAALERVRSRSMAMHKSDELKDVIRVVLKQFVHLSINAEHAGFYIDYKNHDDMHIWLADPNIEPFYAIIPYFDTPTWNSFLEAKEKGTALHTDLLDFEGKNKFYQSLFKLFTVPEEAKEFYLQCRGLAVSTVLLDNVGLYIENFSAIPYTDEENKILMRFGKVFQQTYTRFLDLQKAEAQTRESNIELGLERVRARAMAMQHSNELQELVITVCSELTKLDFALTRCAIATMNEDGASWQEWTAEIDQTAQSYDVKNSGYPYHLELLKNWKQKTDKWVYHLQGDEMKSLTEYLISESGYSRIPKKVQEIMLGTPEIFLSHSFHNFGFIRSDDLQTLSEANLTILFRFSKVFEQAYTRFIDLQKAEAQARESQIELSLERVRAKTMAMHNSADIGETAAVMVNELKKLGIETIRSGIGIMHEPGNMEVWTIATGEKNKTGIIIGWLDMHIHPLLHGAFESWRNKNESYSYELKDDDLLAYYNAINNYPGYPIRYDASTLPAFIHHNEFTFAEGILFAFSLQQLTSEQRKIFKRFAGVFGQTYRRYLDLKKAEAQAREAQIEASLERVRAVAMSMMKSEDLLNICESVFTQVTALGFTGIRAAQIYIRNDEKETFTNYDYSDITGTDVVEVSYNSHPKTRRIYDTIKNASDVFLENVVSKQELDEWKLYLYNTLGQKPEQSLDAAGELHYYFYSVGTGALALCTFNSLSPGQLEILKRFRNVFNLCYQRYTAIALAEAQTREAMIEAGLERVRSRTLAMQKSNELAETAAVVFRQLIGLGIEPNRLYISIIKDNSGDIECWVTDEDGSKVSTQFTGNIYKNQSFHTMYDGWVAQKKSISIDMQGQELADYFYYLGEELNVPFKLGLAQKRRVQNIAYFGKGFIGMASPDEQPEETIGLLERFAAVFNLTYTRFNDLQVAEAHAVQAEEDLIKLQTEKKRAEEALVELRETQKQLIQSEKMASLGELTAGIAHEIQNPLNFVNNFSEINAELIDELKSQKSKLKTEEIEDLLNDIAANEEKINYHGKRADAIVKGMLQHSRTSSGIKESTDINKLADEYLRLAYHGLRAKDKSFNATLETSYDEGTGMINIVPQDIGRVILNLITNAFYAVNERYKAEGVGYKPMVAVSVKKLNNKVEIKVMDNGVGIPQNISDKIFQPFFTTKPTGQGTGLGLSLAYDIIKAHTGEIKVESKVGEGSVFVIELPIV